MKRVYYMFLAIACGCLVGFFLPILSPYVSWMGTIFFASS